MKGIYKNCRKIKRKFKMQQHLLKDSIGAGGYCLANREKLGCGLIVSYTAPSKKPKDYCQKVAAKQSGGVIFPFSAIEQFFSELSVKRKAAIEDFLGEKQRIKGLLSNLK
jgi:hypothetical protein